MNENNPAPSPTPANNPPPAAATPPTAGTSPTWKTVLDALEMPKGQPQGGSGTPTAAPAPPPTPTPAGSPPAESPAPGAAPPPAVPAIPPVALSPEDLNRLVQGVATAVQPPPPAPPPPSEEELNKMLNVFKVGEEDLRAVFGEGATPAHLTFFNNLVQGAARQAVSLASLALGFKMRELDAELAPLRGYVQRANLEATKSRFYTKYPNLKAVEPLMLHIYDQLASQGKFKDVKTEDEAFKLLVDSAVGVLSHVPGVDVQQLISSTAVTPGAPPAGGTPSTPATMPALARGGAPGGVPAAGRGNDGRPIWQKVLVP